MNDTGAVKSAARVLDLLELLEPLQEPIGVSELARRMQIPKSSVFMLLATLEQRGYVESDSEKRFVLNPMFRGGGRSWVGGFRTALIQIAKKQMEALVRATRETSFLATSDGRTIEYIAKVVSPHELRSDSDLHVPRPMHLLSLGMIFLAYQDRAKTEEFLRKAELGDVTPQMTCSLAELREELVATRTNGYAVTRDLNTPGLSGISVPIFNGTGKIVAGLNLSAPSSRFEGVFPKAIPMLLEAAESVTKELNAMQDRISA